MTQYLSRSIQLDRAPRFFADFCLLKVFTRSAIFFLALNSASAFGQAASCPFNASSVLAPAAPISTVDGLLLHRYSSSFRNDSLTKKISRPTANIPEAERYITQHLVRLDIDGDGEFGLTDSIIINRHLSGFKGTALVSNLSFAANAKRKTADEIQSFIGLGCPQDILRDSVHTRALAMWRKVQVKGSCSGCHGADYLDLARIGSSDGTIIRRALNDGATQQEADDLVVAVKALRTHFSMPATNPLTFRPFQPGGELLAGSRGIDRDISFGQTLLPKLPITMTPRTDGQPSVNSLATSKLALRELLAIDLRNTKVGIVYPRWSADIFNGNEHGTLNDWIADLAREPANAADRSAWLALQDTYIRNPSDENFWRMFAAVDKYTADFTPVPMVVPGNYVNDFTQHKFKSALVGQHLMRTQLLSRNTFARGSMAFSYIDESPLRSLFASNEFLPGRDMWEVGDTGRARLGKSPSGIGTGKDEPARDHLAALQLPSFVLDSQRNDKDWNDTEEEIRLPWFWIGFTFDPSLRRISRSNSTQVGEYLVASLRLQRMFMHDAFSQAYRMATAGTQQAANPGKVPGYAPEYGYFMGYGREVINWDFYPRIGETYDQTTRDTQAALWSQFVSNNFRMNMYLFREALANGTARKSDGTPLDTSFPFCPAKRHFDTYQSEHRTHDYALMRALAVDMNVTLTDCSLY